MANFDYEEILFDEDTIEVLFDTEEDATSESELESFVQEVALSNDDKLEVIFCTTHRLMQEISDLRNQVIYLENLIQKQYDESFFTKLKDMFKRFSNVI